MAVYPARLEQQQQHSVKYQTECAVAAVKRNFTKWLFRVLRLLCLCEKISWAKCKARKVIYGRGSCHDNSVYTDELNSPRNPLSRLLSRSVLV